MTETKCEGWRRYGGVMTLGKPQWARCTNDPVVFLTIQEGSESRVRAACGLCWQEVIDNNLTILHTAPIKEEDKI